VTESKTQIPIQLETIEANKWQIYAKDICALEDDVYEPARRLSRDEMARIVLDPNGLAVIALAGSDLVGFAFAAPLEWFADVAGVLQDPEWGRGTTLYSADVTVSPILRRAGVGRQLKVWQIDNARSAGYRYIVGRNRMVLAGAMIALNASLGAEACCYLSNTYRDGIDPDVSMYYKIPLDRDPRGQTVGHRASAPCLHLR
jgi:GNAT superfamily N-acetyltransferase